MLYFQVEAYDDAIQDFTDATRQPRLVPFAHFAIGCCEYLSGRYYAAIDHFKQTIEVCSFKQN